MRLEPRADRAHPLFAQLAIVGRRAHLDQLVRLERAVDLGDDLVGEALVADDDDRIELVRLSAQLAAA
jgi:hypothetical protein